MKLQRGKVMWAPDEQARIRQDVFRWLEKEEVELGGYEFRRQYLRTNYVYRGQVVPLMDRQNGIWNPSGFDSTLSVTRTLKSAYIDDLDGAVQRYSYERLPGSPLVSGRNIKLRAAARNGDPLVLFQEVLPTLYVARYPVEIVRDDPRAGYVDLLVEHSLGFLGDPLHLADYQKRYADNIARTRLHQKSFRTRVLSAYRGECAMCGLEFPSLLDAAHIAPDGTDDDTAAVSNGLALCKIHHAAYDRNLIGIDQESLVRVRTDVLAAAGSSMLSYGLQALEGMPLRLPNRLSERPSVARLGARFRSFTEFTTVE